MVRVSHASLSVSLHVWHQKEAVDSLRLYGGVSIAQNWMDGGMEEGFESYGTPLRDTGHHLQINNSLVFLCIFLKYAFKCAFREVLKNTITLVTQHEDECTRTAAFLMHGYFVKHSAACCLFTEHVSLFND